jgi:hypothetical protein
MIRLCDGIRGLDMSIFLVHNRHLAVTVGMKPLRLAWSRHLSHPCKGICPYEGQDSCSDNEQHAGTTLSRKAAAQDHRARTLKTCSLATLAVTISHLRRVLAAISFSRSASTETTSAAATATSSPAQQPSLGGAAGAKSAATTLDSAEAECHDEVHGRGAGKAMEQVDQHDVQAALGLPTIVEGAAVGATLSQFASASMLPGFPAYSIAGGDLAKVCSVYCLTKQGDTQSCDQLQCQCAQPHTQTHPKTCVLTVYRVEKAGQRQ